MFAKALLLVCGLVGLSVSSAVDVAALGQGQAVTGGQLTTLTYLNAAFVELEIETDVDATVTLSANATLDASLPNDFSSLDFSTGIGYHLQVSGGANIVSATLTTDALTVSALALITGSVEARCLRFDADAQAYAEVPIESTTLNSQLVVELPTVGFYAFAAADLSVPIPRVITLGAQVEVDSTAGATIAFSDAPGLELAISVDATTNVALTSEVALAASTPADYSSFSFGASAGLNLTLSGNAGIVKAKLTTPPLSASVLASITGSVEARCLRFDAEAQAYTEVDVNTTTDQRLALNLPAVGTYVFATADVTATVPTLYLEARATSSSNSRFSYPAGFFLDVATASENEVTVAFSATSARSDPENVTNMGAYFTIDLDSEEEVEATLEYEFDSSVAADVAARLKFAFWDADAGAWTFLESGASVDTEARIVAQATTHFSEWGVFDDNSGSEGAAASSETTLGVGVAVDANVATRVTFSDGPGLELLIKTDSDTTVTFDKETSLSAGLDDEYNTFSIGGNLGFSLSTTGNAGIVEAQLTTPSLSASVLALLTGSVQARCVRFDAEAQAWTGVEVQSMTLSNKLVVDLPDTGMYAFASVDASVPVPTLYLEARATSSTSSKFSYDGGFVLDVATTTDNEVTVEFLSTSSRSEPENRTAVGAFFNIELRDEEAVDATLSFEYDASIDAEVAATLRFAFYDDDNETWTFMEAGANVDTSARVVSQTTVHFSEWGVFASGDAGISEGAVPSSLQALVSVVALVVAVLF
eukprot:INCI8273.1.p1 GENE.INCI8273.1~~INCI8273.1.p1  ORF type:complete len:764 (-),score=167.70 INCI8273.1:30-2321(-)